jgi:hypothetical protein
MTPVRRGRPTKTHAKGNNNVGTSTLGAPPAALLQTAAPLPPTKQLDSDEELEDDASSAGSFAAALVVPFNVNAAVDSDDDDLPVSDTAKRARPITPSSPVPKHKQNRVGASPGMKGQASDGGRGRGRGRGRGGSGRGGKTRGGVKNK